MNSKKVFIISSLTVAIIFVIVGSFYLSKSDKSIVTDTNNQDMLASEIESEPVPNAGSA